jgi:hypothetical protein
MTTRGSNDTRELGLIWLPSASQRGNRNCPQDLSRSLFVDSDSGKSIVVTEYWVPASFIRRQRSLWPGSSRNLELLQTTQESRIPVHFASAPCCYWQALDATQFGGETTPSRYQAPRHRFALTGPRNTLQHPCFQLSRMPCANLEQLGSSFHGLLMIERSAVRTKLCGYRSERHQSVSWHSKTEPWKRTPANDTAINNAFQKTERFLFSCSITGDPRRLTMWPGYLESL